VIHFNASSASYPAGSYRIPRRRTDTSSKPESGNFVAAADAAQQALQIANEQQKPLTKQIESRIKLYQNEQPFREVPNK